MSKSLSEKKKITDESSTALQGMNTFFTEVAELALFTLRFFKEVVTPRYEFKELVKQCYIVGYTSISLIGITGFIMGLVLTIQSRPTLAEFGAESWIPAMVAVSIV